MVKLWPVAVACCWLFVSAYPARTMAASSPPVASGEEIAKVRTQLDEFVAAYITMNNLSVRPSRDHPDVTTRNGQVVVSYIEFVSDSSEILPSSSREFSYLARMTYIEHTYEAVGSSMEDALAGYHARVRSRRLTEFPHYGRGQWRN